MNRTFVKVHLHWLTPEQGGRRSGPPPGPTYLPTAHFMPGGEEFSVVLRWAQGSQATKWEQGAELALLVPENLPDLTAKLIPGARLEINEGKQVVARAEVVFSSVAEMSLPPIAATAPS